MKKIVTAICMLALVAGSLSAKPKDKKKDAKKDAPSGPMTYVLDFADSNAGKKTTFEKNNDYYQSTKKDSPDFSGYIIGRLPKKGDTVELHFKGVSDIDLPGIMGCVMDDSPKANYWLNVISQKDCDTPIYGPIKAGEVFEGTYTFTLTTNVRKNLRFMMFYDHGGAKSAGWEKVGKAPTIKWQKTDAVTTDTSDMVEKKAPSTPVEISLNLADSAKMIEMQAETENGKINAYGAAISIIDLFENSIGRLPIVGDKVTITFEGTSNRDIETPIRAALYESTPAVNWWAELASNNWIEWHSEPIKAGEVFKGSCTFEVNKAAIDGVGVRIYYDSYDGAGAATFIYKK
ncbi:MAG: hypothetical protein IJ688_02220 [Treponema sp.]|nr:hypothetical protein [Treponema sp.]